MAADAAATDARREAFAHALTAMGVRVLPSRAPFLLADFGRDMTETVARLREKRILVTHGRGFHWEQPDHFRIVYLPEIEVLQEACGKLEDFLKTYRQ